MAIFSGLIAAVIVFIGGLCIQAYSTRRAMKKQGMLVGRERRRMIRTMKAACNRHVKRQDMVAEFSTSMAVIDFRIKQVHQGLALLNRYHAVMRRR